MGLPAASRVPPQPALPLQPHPTFDESGSGPLLGRQRSSPGSSEYDTESRRCPSGCLRCDHRNSLPPEAGLLRDALRGEVVDVGHQVKPPEMELIEGIAAEQSEGARCGAPTTSLGGTPVAEVSGLVRA